MRHGTSYSTFDQRTIGFRRIVLCFELPQAFFNIRGGGRPSLLVVLDVLVKRSGRVVTCALLF